MSGKLLGRILLMVWAFGVIGLQAGYSADLDPNLLGWWRFEEVNVSGAVHMDPLCCSTTAGYLSIDDFESYTYDIEAGEAIWQTWLDGIEDPNYGNSGVGYFISDNFIPFVHSGRQAMPFFYDNRIAPWYSQAVRTWDVAQDWTRCGVDTLTLYLVGAPPAFHRRDDGTVFMSGWQDEITSTSDRFQLGSQDLWGDGTIVAKVDSLIDTDPNTRAGVMIRDGSAVGAKNVAIFITAGNGIVFQSRTELNGPTEVVTFAGPNVPYWVRLNRLGDSFSAQCSPDGLDWTDITDADGNSSVHIDMSNDVLIGVALADAGSDYAASAEFSDISVIGNTSDIWVKTRIGYPYRWYWMSVNDPEQLYLEICDAAGNCATVTHPKGPEVTWFADWQPWNISLDRFSTAGVDITNVKSMTIGFGDRDTPTLGGEGVMHFDDIRLTFSNIDDPNVQN